MVVHVKDLLDSDMASEMILAKQIFESGKLLSNHWYYSTELRVLNTQLVYAVLFHFSNDWQLIRILGNIVLTLVLLFSYFFLCNQLKIKRYFPISAAFMLLPISPDYFYILLYGAYYIPRISMMFLILGILLPSFDSSNQKTINPFLIMLACGLSFALGLEGARMILILFIPIFALVFAQSIQQFKHYIAQNHSQSVKLVSFLKQTGFYRYFIQSFFVCLSAAIGYFTNSFILSQRYTFKDFDLKYDLSLYKFRRMFINQSSVIGNSSDSIALSLFVWIVVGLLLFMFVFSKSTKPTIGKRFVWFSLISCAFYSLVSVVLSLGLVSWHFVPISILIFPTVVIALSENNFKPLLKKTLAVIICLALLIIGIPGYAQFKSWPRRANRCNEEFTKIASVLVQEGFDAGYGTFWNGNVLTELTDGKIDVWCVKEFDANTTNHPDLFLWLQDKSHEHTLPSGKKFVIWSRKEFLSYQDSGFPYIGEKVYESNGFTVFEVIQ
jgi:hypothetical protein